jgi:type II secretory pathway component GspD/PulD (secretin)
MLRLELLPQLTARIARWARVGNALVCMLAIGAASGADAPSAAVDGANDLVKRGRHQEAVTLLEAWTKEHPDDKLAAQTLLTTRVTMKENEIRKLLSEQALTKEMIVGDADYEMAKARADKAVRQRLDIVEYYIAQKQYGDAATLCTAILHDYPHDMATLSLKFRILETMVSRERAELLKDQQYRHGESINDVIRDGTFHRDPPKIPRTVWVFDEDIAAAERAVVEAKLAERVTLVYDGSNGTQSTQVREVLAALFPYIGINYVILDDSLGPEKLTIHLVNETAGNALATIAKLVKVRFNYSGGTVYVTSSDSEILVTDIIRLDSGLTDVEAIGQFADLTTASSSGNAAQMLQQQQQAQQQQAQQQAQQAQQAQQQQQKKSDLEKFLDKIPDIIVGWPAEARMYLDRKSNSLYVRSTPSTIAELKRLLHALDYNNVQVLIETRFIEVSEDAVRDLGIDWSGGGIRGPITVGGSNVSSTNPDPATVGTSAATYAPTSGILGATTPPSNGLLAQVLLNQGVNIAAKLTALEQEGKADTLSEPKILTLNNATGKIEVTRDIRYISGYENQGTGGTYPITQPGGSTIYQQQPAALVPQYTKEQEGITLSIIPSVARNSDIITLTLTPSVRELVRAPQASTFNIPNGSGQTVQNIIESPPEFSTRRLFTSLHVQNGQTLALGGLTKEKEEKKMAGVPFISRIPLLGHLFRRDSKSSDRRNLVILVTAHIVDPNGSKLSDEIQRLRDTARVVLPPEAQAELDARSAAPASDPVQQPAAPAAPSRGPTQPWQKNGRP